MKTLRYLLILLILPVSFQAQEITRDKADSLQWGISINNDIAVPARDTIIINFDTLWLKEKVREYVREMFGGADEIGLTIPYCLDSVLWEELPDSAVHRTIREVCDSIVIWESLSHTLAADTLLMAGFVITNLRYGAYIWDITAAFQKITCREDTVWSK